MNAKGSVRQIPLSFHPFGRTRFLSALFPSKARLAFACLRHPVEVVTMTKMIVIVKGDHIKGFQVVKAAEACMERREVYFRE